MKEIFDIDRLDEVVRTLTNNKSRSLLTAFGVFWGIFMLVLLLGSGKGGSRNLVGITIQLSDSEEEEFFVGYPMLISPEKFDFGIERFGCGI